MITRIPYLQVLLGLFLCIQLPLYVIAQDNKLESVGKSTNDEETDSLSNSTTIVDAKEFNRGLINNPLQLIQGRISGLMISKSGSNPNEELILRLRGVQTIGASSDPLIVIDGFAGADLSSIDPADIASIEVLKDVAASSIYGIRGGNGVILINTKTGGSGNSGVRYTSAVSFDKVQQNLSYMSAGEYRRLANASDFGSDTNWLEEVTRTGISQVHNLSLFGGGNHTSYYASANYRGVEGIAKNTGFDRISTRLRISNVFLKEKAKIELVLATTNSNQKLGFNDVFRYSVSTNPTLPVYYDGTTGITDVGGYSERDLFDNYNPLSIAEQAINDRNNTLLLGTLRGEFDFEYFIKGLSLSFSYSNQSKSILSGTYFPSTLKYGNGSNNNGVATKSSSQESTNLMEAKVNFRRETTSLDYSLTGGYSFQGFKNDQFDMQGGNFPTDAFGYNNMAAAQDFANGSGYVNSYASSHKLIAFYGLLDLNINDLYFINASARHEGSSRLGQNNKWHLFTALSLGARLDKLLGIGAFDYLNARISVGSAGRIPESSYLSLQRFGPAGYTFQNGSYSPSYSAISNENVDLGPEITHEVDIGFDFSFQNSKIFGSFDWYSRNTKDMILPVQAPVPPNLFGQTFVNLGQIRNKGIELSINWDLVKSKALNYTTNFTLATYNTTVISLSNDQYSFGDKGVLFRGTGGMGGGSRILRIKEGEPFGDFWGPVFNGMISNGMPMFADLNGDGGFCYCNDDRKVIGNAMPDWSLGWGHSISVGKFEINMFFRGVFGHDIFNEYRADYENLESTTVGNWNVVTTRNFNPSIKRAMHSNLHIENASYFKLDNITLGYRLPNIEKLGVSEAQIFITGQNLFTLTKYSGVDSEVRYIDMGRYSGDEDPMVPGIERKNTYFPSRTISFGIHLGF